PFSVARRRRDLAGKLADRHQKLLEEIFAADKHQSVLDDVVPLPHLFMQKERIRVDDERLGLQMVTSNKCQRKIAHFSVPEAKHEITHPAFAEKIRYRIARKGILGSAVSKKQDIGFLEIFDSFRFQIVVEGAMLVIAKGIDFAICEKAIRAET
ncbi:MAG TPA: hypothetical protein VK479_04820, partial [Micropepsaceae bacterium]|nr:hypothetical protein [Micropepsaceae bacterium]